MTQPVLKYRDGQAQQAPGRSSRVVVVVGAGPYGLSVAAHLRAAGVRVRVFGETMGSWRHAMATGMFLKSTPQATDLSAPVPGGRLADFRRESGEPELTELTPIPCEVFVGYGMWFARRYVGEVEATHVTAVEQEDAGFTVRLQDGEEIEAAAVVVATGLGALAHIPRQLRHLAPEGAGPGGVLSHTSQHADLSRYAGRRVAVVGGGQSALESAALLHEAGAEPHVLVRSAQVRWGAVPVLQRPLGQRIMHPASPLGSGWALSGVCRAPGAVRRLPAATRLWLFRRALGPSGGWWLRDRVEGVVPVHLRRRITQASLTGAEVRLLLAGQGEGPTGLTVDHVLAATGYRIDLDALGFLSEAVRRRVARVPGSRAPHLSRSLESTLPGLYFAGSLAAPMFGPMLRFVAGTAFAAGRISAHLARRMEQR
ncbi:FAD-dependent oxidoreductase [Planomonospora sp. ID67723]|uniref:FAD-dependent oxidoreductase n=1 Tax=Planomonospora sp. ID67723 TaxID=2738134 RepID=UPI0018C3B532|nr:FAD-dependent oxidoreductase [Planomonospora sp. ID67723]MBG0830040.1 FAD-dependent oxidoreductase [Planomonospora sp. ID67723]